MCPDQLQIHSYPHADDEAIVACINANRNSERSVDWFSWKYADHPSTDRAFVQLGVRDDTIIGVVGVIPLSDRNFSEDFTVAVLSDLSIDRRARPADVSRMRERVLERTRDAGMSLAVDPSFPWVDRPRIAGLASGREFEGYVRINRLTGLARAGLTPLYPVYQRTIRMQSRIRHLLDRYAQAIANIPVDIEITSGIDSSIRSLSTVETSDHVFQPRWDDDEFAWRYANPAARCETFLLFRHGTLQLGVVIERARLNGITMTYLSDIRVRTDARLPDVELAMVVGSIVEHHADAHLVVSAPCPLLESALERYGFVPLSRGVLRHTLGSPTWRYATDGIGESNALPGLSASCTPLTW